MKRCISFFALVIMLQGCSGPTSHVENGKQGTIVQISVFYWDSEVRPPRPVVIDIVESTTNGFDTIATESTNSRGEAVFQNIGEGSYHVATRKNEFYTTGTAQFVTIPSRDTTIILRLEVKSRYHFSQDTIGVNVDTSSLGHSQQSSFYNNGTNDTLFWTMDTSLKPDWLFVSPTEGTYPTLQSPPPLDSSSIIIGFQMSDFPQDPWPGTVSLPLMHQFDIDTLFIVFENINLQQ